MLRGLKELFINLLYIGTIFVALPSAYYVARWYYYLKKGAVYKFLKFMSLEHSMVVAVIVFILSAIVFATLYSIFVKIIDFILDFFVEYFWRIIGVSFLGVLAFPFVFSYAFIILPLKQLYIFMRYFRVLIRIKFWNLYPFIFVCVFAAVGFLLYYFNAYDFLELKYKELSKFVLNMKKFDYLAFFYLMCFCFVANLISFVFILFFKKMQTILYTKMYDYLQKQRRFYQSQSKDYEYDEDTNTYKKREGYEQESSFENNQKRTYENARKTRVDESLRLACEIFSINSNRLNQITPEELKRRYHKLARMFHPDLHKDKKEQMDDKMKEINNAYEFLKQQIGA